MNPWYCRKMDGYGIIILDEIHQTQKDELHMHSLMFGNTHTHTHAYDPVITF